MTALLDAHTRGSRLKYWVFSLLVFLNDGANAATWHVPSQAPTIQAGVNLADVGDTVVVACGRYFEHSIQLRPGVSLRSESSDPSCVTIDAQGLGRVMSSIGSSTANYVIEGITFTNGLATGAAPDRWGAGLYCYRVRPTIRYCVFRENSALPYGQGGGVFVQGPFNHPVFYDCKFIDNSADYGGGVRCYYSSTPVFTACVIDSNYAQSEGGGVYTNGSANPRFIESRICDNYAHRSGGGLFVEGSSSWGIVLESCLVAHNSTSDVPNYSNGGGVWIQGNMIMNQCTVTDNYAIHGGGIYTLNSYLYWDNTIVAFNRAGGALYDGNYNITLDLSCLDIYGNVGGDWVGILEDEVHNGRNISADPEFCLDSSSEYYALREGSPCLPDAYCGTRGAFGLGCDATTAIGGAVVTAGNLGRCRWFPNPFNPVVSVQYTLLQSCTVSVCSYDVRGRLLRSVLADVEKVPGDHELTWDGRDDAGAALPSGTYCFGSRRGTRCGR